MAKKKTARKKKSSARPKEVGAIKHEDASRRNIPTAEFQSVLAKESQKPVRVAYERGGAGLEDEKAARNRDLDPQLVWRGKDLQDASDLVVNAPPLFIQEKVHPKALIDDLMRRTEKAQREQEEAEAPTLFADLYADFNGVPEGDAKTEFYQHDANWTNRMILGDSLQVMSSLAEREGLRGKVQCIYLDPPYGIKFNSNFQWSTTSRDVKDGNREHITREPEMVKAFRDTWRDGIHSYLTYLRDRLIVCRDLLHESGSIFVQIGDENVHRVRAVMDEVFGDTNAIALIPFLKSSSTSSPSGKTDVLSSTADYLLWYAKSADAVKYRDLYQDKSESKSFDVAYRFARDGRAYRISDVTAQKPTTVYEFEFDGRKYSPLPRGWRTVVDGMRRAVRADRVQQVGNNLAYLQFFDDYPIMPFHNVWSDTVVSGFTANKQYIVETSTKVIERCLLMATDPGDLVLDPTCGSGTTATVAEQWGRRWITIDTSRVALALARARVMGARYPFYLLADSADGARKEAEVTRTDLPDDLDDRRFGENIRHGFVYERVPHITLKSIADNTEIDTIWERMQPAVESALADLNKALAGHEVPFRVQTGGRQGKTVDFTAPKGKTVKLPSGEDAPAGALLEWEVPRDPGSPWSAANEKLFATIRTEQQKGEKANRAKMDQALRALNANLKRSYTLKTLPERPVEPWPAAAEKALEKFWVARIARQREIDASIQAKAEFEYLYDKPYEDKKKVRVAGPFTVESISPHRTLGVDEDDELIDPAHPRGADGKTRDEQDFVEVILENLKTAGVQQAHKEDRIEFSSLAPWPGHYICAEGRYTQGGEGAREMRAGVFIGPEFGTVSRQDLVLAAREAGDADFDVLIACAFNYEAHASEFSKLGRVPVLKARMNADLHMAGELKNTGKGNLFVIFGEPDIEIHDPAEDGDPGTIRVQIKGVDVFHPQSGEVRSDGPDGIACWFIDTDYNEESFFVRHAYFLGANDPYKSLRTSLKAEIDEDAWATLNSDISRPFPKPQGGRIAVKVINHLGDEVMKVFRVE